MPPEIEINAGVIERMKKLLGNEPCYLRFA
jgi:hypothetical protein